MTKRYSLEGKAFASYIFPYFFICILITHVSITSAQTGVLDVTFGNKGKVVTHVADNSKSAGKAVVIQSDGKYVVGGVSSNGTTPVFTLIRYNTDGSLDATFGNNGKVFTRPIGNSYDEIYRMAIQNDGKIIAAGTTGYPTNGNKLPW